MQGLQRGLVPPEKMAKLLEEMLDAQPRAAARLAAHAAGPALRDAGAAPPAKPGEKGAKPAPKDPERTVYQHSVEITLQGSYVRCARLSRTAREAVVADVLGAHQREQHRAASAVAGDAHRADVEPEQGVADRMKHVKTIVARSCAVGAGRNLCAVGERSDASAGGPGHRPGERPMRAMAGAG